MELLKAEIPLNCEIALHGDTHIGSTMYHHAGINKMKKWLLAKRDSRFFVHMGDAIEGITVDDKRFDFASCDEPIPLEQVKRVVEIYKPIAGQCLAWLKGNHEDTLKRFGDLSKLMTDENHLNVPYGTWTCKLKLTHKEKQICKMFLSHGFRGRIVSNAKDYEQQQANMKASLKRKLIHKASDCLIMCIGHTHLLLVCPPAEKLILRSNDEELIQEYLKAGNGADSYIEPDRRWYGNTGSFLKLYQIGIDGYAERAGYDPVELGYLIVKIRDGIVQDIEKVVL